VEGLRVWRNAGRTSGRARAPKGGNFKGGVVYGLKKVFTAFGQHYKKTTGKGGGEGRKGP